jgi:uncharacterized RDD family membrane protein YckC
MDNASETPAAPPPPPLPASYTPPPPSLASTEPPTPPQEQPGEPKLKIRVTDNAPADEAAANDLTAPFNTRAIAAVIDCLLAFGLQIAAALILPSFFGNKIPWLIGIAYLVTRDSLPFLGGQSVGKKAMHIKAVTLDGKSLCGNWEPSLIRSGVLVIPLFVIVELFILISREDKPEHGRRLGDEWAKTKVILAKDPPKEEAPGNQAQP